MSNKTYDFLKFLAQILLPALGTLYFALANIWGLPAAEQVVGTIVAVDTFLGVILKLSTNSYENSDRPYSGAINVIAGGDGNTLYQLELDGRPEQLAGMSEVTFKIKPGEGFVAP